MSEPTVHSLATKVEVLEERMNAHQSNYEAIVQTLRADMERRDADYRESAAKRDTDHQAAIGALSEKNGPPRTPPNRRPNNDNRPSLHRLPHHPRNPTITLPTPTPTAKPSQQQTPRSQQCPQSRSPPDKGGLGGWYGRFGGFLGMALKPKKTC